MKTNTIVSFKKIYALYAGGLKFEDIKRLIKQDVALTYSFYVRRMKKPESKRGRLYTRILFFRNLFIEFLKQLSPVRRLLYSAALFIFIWSYLNGSWGWTLVSVFMFNLLIAFELADKLTAKDELEVARDIQFSLMPGETPKHSVYQISFFCEPATEVGGDYFDFLSDKNGSSLLRVIIGDISGKGMAAALHMVQVKSIVGLLADNATTPKESLCMLNKSLSAVFRNGLFFTTTFLNINPDNSLSLCRAGHLPVIYYSRKAETSSLLTPKGIGIGLAENIVFNSNLEQMELNPSPGDILLLFTDGITETMNENGGFFSENRLQDIVNNNAYKSAEQIKECILDSIRDFAGDMPGKDDITLIVLKHL